MTGSGDGRQLLPTSVPRDGTRLVIDSQCQVTVLGLGLALADAGFVEWEQMDPGAEGPVMYYPRLLQGLEEQLVETGVLSHADLTVLSGDEHAGHDHR